MRIIAGTKRSLKLVSPKELVSRPILDRVKESVFNVLGKYNVLQKRRVADLFCGVGSMGLEALSRGAGEVCFVEKDPQIAKILNTNIEKCDFIGRSKVVCGDAFEMGAPVGSGRQCYSIIFVDPPYSLSQDVSGNSSLGRLLDKLTSLLTEDGIVVVRTHKATELLAAYGRLKVIERRRWGDTAVTILRTGAGDE